VRLYTELYEFSPFKLGSLRIQGNKILAIVVDVDRYPPCKCEWVRAALRQIFEHVKQVRPRALTLPLLGHSYGGLPAETCIRLIVEALLEYRAELPPIVTLYMDTPQLAQAHTLLTAAGLLENRVHPLFSD
jgi:hypothetical protein